MSIFFYHRAGQKSWVTGDIPESAHTDYENIRRNVIACVYQGSSKATLPPWKVNLNRYIWHQNYYLISGRLLAQRLVYTASHLAVSVSCIYAISCAFLVLFYFGLWLFYICKKKKIWRARSLSPFLWAVFCHVTHT